MLPQVHTQISLLDIFTFSATPAPRVELVLQTPRAQPSMTAPISPPRLQHAPSTNFDPFTNPWIEEVYNRKNNSPSIPTNPILLYHSKSNIAYIASHAMEILISALNQPRTLWHTICSTYHMIFTYKTISVRKKQ